MLIILPNLKHSFISPVPVPVPDYGFRFRGFSIRPSEHNREVADRYISYSNGLIIFTAHSSKLSSMTMFSCTYKLFLAKLHVFWGYRSREKGNFTRPIVKILPHIFPSESDDCNTSNRLYARLFGYNQNLLTSQERTMVITP